MLDCSELSLELAQARAETDRLFTHLDPTALYDRPIAERHRMIFYVGHLEAFDWNQMKESGMVENSPVPEFDRLFAFGIDPEPGKLPHDVPSDWPGLPEVSRYNLAVRASIDRNIDKVPEDSVRMMIEHRHMHAETFAYILHSLELEKKTGPVEHLPDEVPCVPQMISIRDGVATMGRKSGAGFGWDNEFQQTVQFVPQFGITRFKITNGEYLSYMQLTGAPAPYYWFQQDGRWFYRGMFQNIPLPESWPVFVTWDQASSYAKFRKLALPSEAQFHRAAFGTPDPEQERLLPWQSDRATSAVSLTSGTARHGNFGYSAWNPIPVNGSPGTESAWGVAQTVGNGWEWTSSIFAPFPGFAAHANYPGYSANFFDNSHYVLKGASPRTASLLVRRSLRNWFRPEYPYVYATFHLVEN